MHYSDTRVCTESASSCFQFWNSDCISDIKFNIQYNCTLCLLKCFLSPHNSKCKIVLLHTTNSLDSLWNHQQMHVQHFHLSQTDSLTKLKATGFPPHEMTIYFYTVKDIQSTLWK